MSRDTAPGYTAHQIRLLAVAAVADPRTIARYLRGESVRPTVAERIARAVAELVEEPTDA